MQLVKTSEFRGGGGLNTLNPPPRYANGSEDKQFVQPVLKAYTSMKVKYR